MLPRLVAPLRFVPRAGAGRFEAQIAGQLAKKLAASIGGEVRFDAGSRALYATDASNYRQLPWGVVIPRSVEELVTTVAICREFGAPILPRGAGTSLCGQCCNDAVVIDCSKYLNRILAIDPQKRIAIVEPGVVLDDLRNAAEVHHLTFAPDPATHTHNTLGGMIGNNSCGVHSVMGGETVDNVVALEVLTYDGERMRIAATDERELQAILRAGGRRAEIHQKLYGLASHYGDEIRAHFPAIPRRVSGFNLPALLPENGFNVAKALVGSEGTCALVLNATLRLVDSPPARSLLALGYPDVFAAGDHVVELMKFKPIGLEGIDDRLIADMKSIKLHPGDLSLLPAGGGWLLVEFGGDSKDEADAQAKQAMDWLKKKKDAPSMKLYDDPAEEKLLWRIRESGLGATAHVPNKKITWEGWEDSSVPPEKLGIYLRRLRTLLDRYDYTGDLYGHFGQGCVHTRIDFDLETTPGIKKFRAFLHEAAELVVSLGGSVSGEHGDGQSKAELLPIMFGEELMQAFREFKRIWDPDGQMNPGKIIDAYRPDENLRIGSNFEPPAMRTHFHYTQDNGDFSHALLRCVGVGECRKAGGTMCPSYQATREEMHSTRGRARLLFEMMKGEAVHGWKDDAVRTALDLCLSCKGCKGECPVGVDMATYKAEFMAHYYAHRLRPLTALLFGRIDRWARLASTAPALVNGATRSEPLARLAKKLGHIHPQRRLPRFAKQSFVAQYLRASRESTPAAGMRVILWPDTFNNYFHPDTALAAAAELEAAGCNVIVPKTHLCCGRPLYEWGLLDAAKRYLRRTLAVLHDEIIAGTPVIVLEPACASVFRDELGELLPFDEQAKRLRSQTFVLSEFLRRQAPHYLSPKLARKAILHGHCHQKSLLGMADEEALLRDLGVDLQVLDSGCCGMAGSFGFDEDHYQVSLAVGERVLLPAVREAASDTLIVANGFSCREQIAQTTVKRAMHLAEVLHMARTLRA